MSHNPMGLYGLLQGRHLILYTLGRTPWAGDQPVARPLPTEDNTNRINLKSLESLLRIAKNSMFIRTSFIIFMV
jgi:hypothetical protein